ncbi:MAG: ECF transporter S component [Lachnospiraceae bacterium]|nr:ECF transporter S component [Lachnospiraceae bacterium]MCH4070152.1 ECF transporter S component [Lachnospiraceae bacterium]MCH4108496.1 ECF transporter S component [Lachnospiraceae bacterium]MCI1302489.1 ECF transporter S component [Lachnospiraceae bacterium]MCI1331662.1 ECF transporter S component [Lachnospiraceae bacterium]
MASVTANAANASKAQERPDHIKKLAFAAVFAAITYVVFTFLSIRIPTPGGGQVSVHLGNAFVVLGALFLGSVYGGIGGAIGLTIGDLLDPVYIVESPVTFIVKFLMGVIVGLIAHKAGHITTRTDTKGILKWVIISTIVGLLFNVFVDPSLRYVYKILVLGKPAADVSFAINFGVTVINSVVSAVIVVVLYMALRKPLRKMGLFFTF